MFSSNEKISGRQAFRLLVFDLLGLGTLLIPAAVAGFCGRDGIFCIDRKSTRQNSSHGVQSRMPSSA